MKTRTCVLAVLVSSLALAGCATTRPAAPERDCTTETRRMDATPVAERRLAADSPVAALPDGTVIRGIWFEPVPSETKRVSLTIYYTEPSSDEPKRTAPLREGDYFGPRDAYVVERVAARAQSLAGLAAILVEEATLRHRSSGTRFVLTSDGRNNRVTAGR